MEIISRKNEYFFLAVTYKSDGDNLSDLVMAHLPREALKNRRAFNDVDEHNKALNKIWAKVVEVSSIEELEELLDQEEQRLLMTLKNNREVARA